MLPDAETFTDFRIYDTGVACVVRDADWTEPSGRNVVADAYVRAVQGAKIDREPERRRFRDAGTARWAWLFRFQQLPDTDPFEFRDAFATMGGVPAKQVVDPEDFGAVWLLRVNYVDSVGSAIESGIDVATKLGAAFPFQGFQFVTEETR